MGIAKYFLLIYFLDLLVLCKPKIYPSLKTRTRLQNKFRHLDLELIKDAMLRVKSIKFSKGSFKESSSYHAGEMLFNIRKKFRRMVLLYKRSNANVKTVGRHKILKNLNEIHRLSYEIDKLVEMFENDEEVEKEYDKGKTKNVPGDPRIHRPGPAGPGGQIPGGQKPGGQKPGANRPTSSTPATGRPGADSPGGGRPGEAPPRPDRAGGARSGAQIPEQHLHKQTRSLQRFEGRTRSFQPMRSTISYNERQTEPRQPWLQHKKMLRIRNPKNKNIETIRFESGFDSDFH